MFEMRFESEDGPIGWEAVSFIANLIADKIESR